MKWILRIKDGDKQVAPYRGLQLLARLNVATQARRPLKDNQGSNALLAHHAEEKSPVYLALMDASKAFDVVDNDSALLHLYDQGIKGHLWHLYNSL